MRAIWIMALKDLRLLAADRVGFFFVFCWPLLYAVFFGFVTSRMYGSGGEANLRAIPVAFVDEDHTDASAQLLERLSKKDTLEIQDVPTRADGEDLVRRGKRAACIIVPAGYGAASKRIFWGDPMTVEVVVDPSRAMEGGMLQGQLFEAGFGQLQNVFGNATAMRDVLHDARDAIAQAPEYSGFQKAIFNAFFAAADQLYAPGMFGDGETSFASSQPTTATADNSIGMGGWQPFRVEIRNVAQPPSDEGSSSDESKASFNAYSIVFPQGVAWGVMACAATFAITLVVERTRGTLPRLAIAPIARWQILAGKGLACFVATTFVASVILLIGRLFFGVHPSSFAMLALGVLCISIAIVGVMMLFAVLGKTEAAVGGMSWAILIIMAMLGGGMLPLNMLGGWLQTCSYVSIFRWAILALEGSLWRGFTHSEMALPCGILLLIGVGGFVLGTAVFRLDGAK